MKIIIFFTLITLKVLNINAQKLSSDKVPANVVRTFKQQFPEAFRVKWILEDNKNYEVEFKLHKQEQSAIYSPEAKWIESEIEIKSTELPTSVIQNLNIQFPGYKIEEASKIDDVQFGKGFEVEIEKGEQTYEIRFSPNGEILNKKPEQENKKNKD